MSKLPDFISIIIPAYNEEKRVAQSLTALSAFCDEHFEKYELLIVNDGSTDKTRNIVENLSIPFLETLHLESNQGKGQAVKLGMLAAQGAYRFFTDADLPYDLKAFPEALRVFHSTQCDGVVGARDLPESTDRSSQSLLRRRTSKCFSALVRLLLTVDMKDTQCGFKGFTAESAATLFSVSKIKGYAFDVELFLLAAARHLRIARIPVTLVRSGGSKIRMRVDVLFMVRDLLRLALNPRYQSSNDHKKRLFQHHR
jgi:dolichyl-phosphate beta-glucosyltransferase